MNMKTKISQIGLNTRKLQNADQIRDAINRGRV